MAVNVNDLLPSWRDGQSRRAIVRFVETVTSRDDPDYVPPPERVAVFDNDGTLWCEKPMYIQLDFALRRLQRAAAGDASLRERQPWKAAYEEDYEWLGGAVTHYYRGDDTRIRQLLGGIVLRDDPISRNDARGRAAPQLSPTNTWHSCTHSDAR